MFQLFVRDLLSDEMIDLVDRLPTEQKKKQYLVSIIEGLKETAEWQQSGFAGKTVKTEAKKFREMRRNMRERNLHIKKVHLLQVVALVLLLLAVLRRSVVQSWKQVKKRLKMLL